MHNIFLKKTIINSEILHVCREGGEWVMVLWVVGVVTVL